MKTTMICGLLGAMLLAHVSGLAEVSARDVAQESAASAEPLSPLPKSLFAQYAVSGSLDLREDAVTVTLTPQDQSGQGLSVEVHGLHRPKRQVFVDLQDFSTPLAAVTMALQGEIQGKQPLSQGAVFGKGIGRQGIINGIPISDVSAQFEWTSPRFKFRASSEGLTAEGSWLLTSPYDLALVVAFSGIRLRVLAEMLNLKSGQMSGAVSGRVQIGGPPENLFIQAAALVQEGHLKDLFFRDMILKGEGYFPHVRVYDSVVHQIDGLSFRVQGPLDLSQSRQLAQQIDALQKDPIIHDQEGEYEWTIKRVDAEDGKGTTEIKYMRRTESDVQTMSEDDSSLIGIEQRMSF